MIPQCLKEKYAEYRDAQIYLKKNRVKYVRLIEAAFIGTETTIYLQIGLILRKVNRVLPNRDTFAFS